MEPHGHESTNHQIGNSRGIRVPKAMLDEARLPDEVELYSEPGRLLVRPARLPREGWATAAKSMHEGEDDRLLDAPTSTRFDEEEWEWR